MTLNEFRLLDAEEQTDRLHREGVYIGKQKKGRHTILLYQLDSFYVEVFYAKHRCLVRRVHSFSSTDGLDPYLAHMDVEPLLQD